MILSNKVAQHLGVDSFACNKDNFLLFMHLGVVKVGLLRLAKPEVISQHIILAKTKTPR